MSNPNKYKGLTAADILSTVPDWLVPAGLASSLSVRPDRQEQAQPDSQAVLAWMEECRQEVELFQGARLLEGAKASPALRGSGVGIGWNEIQEDGRFPFGLYSSLNWRRWVLAAFLADLISYPKSVDQVSFDRLAFVMHLFPRGFKVWWVQAPSRRWCPVGYTGWYPISEMQFDLLEKQPDRLKDRMVVPSFQPNFRPISSPISSQFITENELIYLFNFSVVPCFRKSTLSRTLMQDYAQDIDRQSPKGLSCITVSEDGARVASRFGMSCSGRFVIDGSTESVYASRVLK